MAINHNILMHFNFLGTTYNAYKPFLHSAKSKTLNQFFH
nr:MAG TPA: hypothetical protein [Bacteriophage sp.]